MPADDTPPHDGTARDGSGRDGAAGPAAPGATLDEPAGVWEGDESQESTAGEPVAPEPPPRSRAGRNLPAAIGVGVGLGALIVVTLFVYRPSFGFVVGAAALYGTWELAQALRTVSIRLTLTPLLVGGAALLAAAWLKDTNGLVIAALVTLLGIVIWRVGDGAHGYTRDAAASAFVLLYVPVLAAFAVLLAHPDDGAARVLALVATVVCSDTGGYATGVLFGRHPLAPVVSKAKTWEGFAGSVLACSAAGVLFLTLTFHQAWWQGLLFGLAVVVTATLGDLGESMVKRDLGIKDMGRLLPGHGGVMDRLDSLLPCAAVGYLLLSLFAPV
ncbi:phosphatidate cytidylyltransferase [Jatrophihabitans endophyticus]|uniref:Phosphatidate cytidylyltransferase n=1 Tax=Jatrophihabitans endophyticus TaxID=1206085 RepID=A0A1M5CBN2_9ACTN|nr:phosphatidate cytidylyltransferase [Jatrophihabitans endophyticus]SHF52086.1 phosphatidate cytidylyltransferase [Jatrophihabitans endophyticus]